MTTISPKHLRVINLESSYIKKTLGEEILIVS